MQTKGKEKDFANTAQEAIKKLRKTTRNRNKGLGVKEEEKKL